MPSPFAGALTDSQEVTVGNRTYQYIAAQNRLKDITTGGSGASGYTITASPSTVAIGGVVSIVATGFVDFVTNTPTATVDGISATVSVTSATEIGVTVPPGVSVGTGKVVSVSSSDGSDTATIEITAVDVFASAIIQLEGNSAINDGSNVSALVNSGTGTFSITQSDPDNRPVFVSNAFGTLNGWQAVNTGSDSTRDSFDISPSLSLPATGWTFMAAGTIVTGTIFFGSTSQDSQIRIPNGAGITARRSGTNHISDPIAADTGTDTNIWTIVYTGTQYEFFEGTAARGTKTASGNISGLNRIGEISSNIIRNDCTMGEIVVWDSALSSGDRAVAINSLATKYGITV